MANPVVEKLHIDSLIRRVRGNPRFFRFSRICLYLLLTALPETQLVNEYLSKNWQDWVLTNIISVNYFNRLLVLTSIQDFSFTVPTNYSIQYIQNSGSFYQTISQLATDIRQALTNARQDLNRVHTGMERVPEKLKIMAYISKRSTI